MSTTFRRDCDLVQVLRNDASDLERLIKKLKSPPTAADLSSKKEPKPLQRLRKIIGAPAPQQKPWAEEKLGRALETRSRFQQLRDIETPSRWAQIKGTK